MTSPLRSWSRHNKWIPCIVGIVKQIFILLRCHTSANCYVSALILNKLLKSPVDATDLLLLRSWYIISECRVPHIQMPGYLKYYRSICSAISPGYGNNQIRHGQKDKPHMRASPCKLGAEVVLTNSFWWTLFRIIDSSDKQLWPSAVKENVFLLMQSLYYQRHAVIYYLANASLQSWFKNRLELLINSFFYECIKCQTITNQTV